MEDKFEELKNSWKEAKKEQKQSEGKDMLDIVLKNQSRSKNSHIWNALILAFSVIGLIAFFYFLAPLQETLSRIGIGLMVGGLILRILIEVYSYQRGAKIDYLTNSRSSAHQASEYLAFRKWIHGPVTIAIISFYTIGFYSLTPEFMKYLSTKWLLIFDTSYIFIGAFMVFVIRKGVIQEMHELKRINEILVSMKEE